MIEVLWIPLGAGERVVKLSGRIFEAMSSLLQRRHRCSLYHSALIVSLPDGRYVVEMAPVPDGDGAGRGVVAEGAVGLGPARRLRVFRYEVRRWRDGVIPDEPHAVSRLRVDAGEAVAQRLLGVAERIPTPVWGRDQLRAGEMWNSNSVTSWLLVRSGLDPTDLGPPPGGRAPGWDAGITVARRPLD